MNKLFEDLPKGLFDPNNTVSLPQAFHLETINSDDLIILSKGE